MAYSYIDRQRPWVAASLLHVEQDGQYEWPPAELADILRDCFDAPIAFNAAVSAAPQSAGAATSPTSLATDYPAFNSFADLLHHPSPPIELLRWAKQQIKEGGDDLSGTLPAPISKLFYYAAIAAALCRHGELITRLCHQKIRAGFEWALRQEWVDQATRDLFREALARLAELTTRAMGEARS